MCVQIVRNKDDDMLTLLKNVLLCRTVVILPSVSHISSECARPFRGMSTL